MMNTDISITQDMCTTLSITTDTQPIMDSTVTMDTMLMDTTLFTTQPAMLHTLSMTLLKTALMLTLQLMVQKDLSGQATLMLRTVLNGRRLLTPTVRFVIMKI